MCDTLVIKCKRALEETGLKRVVIAGGVSANKQLRADLEKLAKKSVAKCITHVLNFVPITER